MKRSARVFLLTLVVLIVNRCLAQPFSSGALLDLPRSSSSIIQDRGGNIWFVTVKNGVCRFDGKNFTGYTEKDGLSSDHVFCLLEDARGIIWMGTADGITCFDGKKFTTIPITKITGRFGYTKTKNDPYGMPYPGDNFVSCLMQEVDGMIWIGTSAGIFRYDGDRFSHFAVNDGVINKTGFTIGGEAFGVEAIVKDKSGNVWFGGRGTSGLFRFDGTSLHNYQLNGANWVRPLLQDKSGNVWFSTRTNSTLFRYDGKSFERISNQKIPGWVFFMTEDSAGTLWFGNVKYDGKSFKHMTRTEGSCIDSAWGVLSDRNGKVWFSDREKYLCFYDGKQFKAYMP